MLPEKNTILGFNQYIKSDKVPHIIYADIESLINKRDRYANNPENSSTTKIDEHIPCGYSMPMILAFNSKHTLYSRKDCIKKFSESLREQAKNIDFEKKKSDTVSKR